MKRFALAAIVLVGAACVVALNAQPPSRAEVKVTESAVESEMEDAAQSLPGMILGPLRANGARDVAFRKNSVGSRVIVEGIAWGQPFGLKGQDGSVSPWAGPQVIHQGGSIFVKGIDFTKTKARESRYGSREHCNSNRNSFRDLHHSAG